MRKTFLLICLIIVNAIPFSDIKANGGVEPGLGFPAGYMDISFDASVYRRIPVINRGDIEFRLQGSFATKGDGYKGRLFNIVASSYVLGRYVIATYIDDMTPFIAAGAGLHRIRSWANEKSPLHDFPQWTLTAKAHLFYGMEYKLGGNKYLIFQGRMTYPSDILFDLWFLGVGLGL